MNFKNALIGTGKIVFPLGLAGVTLMGIRELIQYHFWPSSKATITLYGYKQLKQNESNIGKPDDNVALDTPSDTNTSERNATAASSNATSTGGQANNAISPFAPPAVTSTTEDPATVKPAIETILIPDMIGTAGNDAFFSTANGAVIDGGQGIDTVVYPGKRADYQVVPGTDGATQIKPVNGTASDTLRNIERIAFQDGDLALDIDGSAGQIYRLYQATFNRAPDQGGMGYWLRDMDQGMSLPEVARHFIASDEFKTSYGTALSDAEYVHKLLGNVPLRGGKNEFVELAVEALQHGATREKVLTILSEGDANKAATAATIGAGLSYQPASPKIDIQSNGMLFSTGDGNEIIGGPGVDTVVYQANRSNYKLMATPDSLQVLQADGSLGDTLRSIERLAFKDIKLALDIDGPGGQLHRLYHVAFDRAPDAQGMGYWLKDMDQGMDLRTVVNRFIASQEFQTLYSTTGTNHDYVLRLYQHMRHARPKADEIDYWTTAMEQGLSQAEVLQNFAESTENRIALVGKMTDEAAYM